MQSQSLQPPPPLHTEDTNYILFALKLLYLNKHYISMNSDIIAINKLERAVVFFRNKYNSTKYQYWLDKWQKAYKNLIKLKES